MPLLSRKKALSLWNQSIDAVGNRQVWSAGLLMLSSAALGGIAVALWNRQALARMRAEDQGGGDTFPQPQSRATSIHEED